MKRVGEAFDRVNGESTTRAAVDRLASMNPHVHSQRNSAVYNACLKFLNLRARERSCTRTGEARPVFRRLSTSQLLRKPNRRPPHERQVAEIVARRPQ